jgi:hypothetical protein
MVILQGVVVIACGRVPTRAEDVKAQMVSEGVPALARIEQTVSKLKADVEAAEKSKASKPLLSKMSLSYNSPWFLEVMNLEIDWETVPPTKRDQLPVEFVRGMNSRAFFYLSRTRSGAFTVRSVEPLDSSKLMQDNSDPVGPRSTMAAESISAGWIVHRRSLGDWLTADGFRVTGAEAVAGQSGRIVRAKLAYSPPNGQSVIKPIEKFTAVVDFNPDAGWRIERGDYNYTVGTNDAKSPTRVSKNRISIEYGTVIDGCHIPSRVTTKRSIKDNETTFVTTVRSVEKADGLDEDYFLPTRFGVPDVTSPYDTQTSNRTAYILSASFLTCVVLAIVLRRLATRDRSVTA